jgi:ABC-type transporter Mla MlaB component
MPSDGLAAPRGVVRLLNTTGGRLLCLAGEVDAAAVAAFLRRYGREPARVDAIDAGSVTALSAEALELLLDHLEAAEQAGRAVDLRPSPTVERSLTGARSGAALPDRR